jgi:endonuclease G
LHERVSAICIHVEEKRPRRFVPSEELFPKQILGVPVDIVERIHRAHSLPASDILARQILPNRPLHPGVAISAEDGNFGTVGLIVFDRVDGAPCLLSAAHVLRAGTTSTIIQPGANAGGTRIGQLTRWILDSDGDAAIARLDGGLETGSEPLGLEVVANRVEGVRLHQHLSKSSARTGVTEGVVSSVGEISVTYDDDTSIVMKGFEIRPVDLSKTDEISDQGDSGALWQDVDAGSAVGLTVGGDRFGVADPDEFVLVCHLSLVFDRLQITLDSNDRLSV